MQLANKYQLLQCINCAACSNFAPTVFERNSDIYKHVVFHQPNIDKEGELESARAAMQACPVNAIKVDHKNNIVVEEGEDEQEELKGALLSRDRSFPKSICPMILSSDGSETVDDIGVFYLGYHNSASFGAIPYLCIGKSPDGNDISIMVDVPRYSPAAVSAVKSLVASGPDYLFLTHVDDTADHNKWKREFPAMKRIFHSGDLGKHNWIGDLTLENVEILLKDGGSDHGEDLVIWDINGIRQPVDKLQQQLEPGQSIILHTPGHSPGSISLLFRPLLQSTNENKEGKKVDYPNGILFTGDTYSWTTRDGGHMSGFPRYGNNLELQAATLKKLGNNSDKWDIVSPGHGHLRSYLEQDQDRNKKKMMEMKDALEELLSYKSWKG